MTGPEVRTPDADVDDVSNALAGESMPRAAAKASGEICHLVQHGAVFGDIDFQTAEHGLAAFFQTPFARQVHEQTQGFIGKAMFEVVQVGSRSLGCQPRAPLRIVPE